MLVDHAAWVNRVGESVMRRRALPAAFGAFIAGLCVWDWWVTLTFRNEMDSIKGCEAVLGWNAAIVRATGVPVGWMFAEEFGKAGGRWHCHQLMAGTMALSRRFWWQEAYRRFGRSRIEPFDANRCAAYYAAKYAAKTLGNLHFGGQINGVKLDDVSMTPSQVAKLGLFPRDHQDAAAVERPVVADPLSVVPSASSARTAFHTGLGRLKRHHCRWPIKHAKDDDGKEQTLCQQLLYPRE